MLSEQITTLLLFQPSHYRIFKHFYLQEIGQHLSAAFPKGVSYTRFISFIPAMLMPLCAFLQTIQATSKGLAFIDSTSITVCHYKRIKSHKVFKDIAQLGKTTKGLGAADASMDLSYTLSSTTRVSSVPVNLPQPIPMTVSL
jgi:hypothetical protein